MKLTPSKQRALQALLMQPTKEAAAKAAGIATRTLRNYLSDPDFQNEYKKAFGQLIHDATKQAQQALSPALSVLSDIVNNDEESSSVRIAAARSLLEYGLRLTEISDILTELATVEGD